LTKQLDGKVALITGGARGQGRAHALTLARAGADVVICDIAQGIGSVPYGLATQDDLEETAAAVRSEGRRCVAIQADVRDAAAIDAVVDRALRELGRVDIAVANAGIWAPGPVASMSAATWQDVIDVNLTGVFNTIRSVARPMCERGSGRIVATASTLGRQGMQTMSNYVATKWGVIGLVKSAAIELGPFGVSVNAVCPSTVNTPATANPVLYGMFRPDKDEPTYEDVDEMLKQFNSALPVGWLSADDIADAVLFLVSDQARNVTGTALDVTAGLSTQYAS
jgi:SDR family mycofactocin-dependent oxidoreductase